MTTVPFSCTTSLDPVRSPGRAAAPDGSVARARLRRRGLTPSAVAREQYHLSRSEAARRERADARAGSLSELWPIMTRRHP